MHIQPFSRNPRAIDLTGQRFGRLYVIGYVGKTAEKNPRMLWACQCDCGSAIRPVSGGHLRTGHTTSCGCLTYDNAAKARGVHFKSRTSIYRTWQMMKDRCHNPANKQFHSYGERGIAVCARWRNSFENFLADMGERPSPNHSIDRIDNDGDYSPENCRWATLIEQNNNTRQNINLTYQGKTQSLTMWCRELHLKYSTVRARLLRGWSVQDALTLPTSANTSC